MFVSVCFCRSVGLAHPHLSVIVLLKNCAAEAAKTRTIREQEFQVKHCSGDISGENGIALAEKEILLKEKQAYNPPIGLPVFLIFTRKESTS